MTFIVVRFQRALRRLMVIKGSSSSLEEVLMTRRGMITTELPQEHDKGDNRLTNIVHVRREQNMSWTRTVLDITYTLR